jgi:putative sigma-54 modulation protein
MVRAAATIIPGRPDVVIEDTESDLYVAIDRAVERIERSVARRLERQREHPHGRLRTAAPHGSGAAMTVLTTQGDYTL